MMVGRSLDTLFPKQEVPIGRAVLQRRRISRAAASFADVSFELRRGEILGLAGLVGAGRSEVGQAIAGMFPADGGEILLDGQPLRGSQRAGRHERRHRLPARGPASTRAWFWG